MSVLCIVLDGWHLGETLMLPSPAPPSINLYRPRVVTTCECSPNDYYESAPTSAAFDTLKLAFRSIDGETALYSTDGSSRPITNRGWVAPRDGRAMFYKPNDLLYVGCRDHRAWPEYSAGVGAEAGEKEEAEG